MIDPKPGNPNLPDAVNIPDLNPPGDVFAPHNIPNGPNPGIDNPAINPPRFQQPVFEQVWTCSRCGGVIGRGAERPSVYSCPNCGARLSGPWTLVGALAGGVIVGLIFLFKLLFNRS